MNTVLPSLGLQKELMAMKLRSLKPKSWQVKIKWPRNLMKDM